MRCKKCWLYSFILLISIIISGCSVRHGDFTVVSNKLVRLSEFELEKADRVRGIEGKDVQHIIIFIPTSGPPTIEGALDNAIEEGGGDVMTDAVIEAWGFYIPYIYGQAGWSVKGDVVKTRKY
jgi:hypothetical protein